MAAHSTLPSSSTGAISVDPARHYTRCKCHLSVEIIFTSIQSSWPCSRRNYRCPYCYYCCYWSPLHVRLLLSALLLLLLDPTANYHYCYENNSGEWNMTRVQVSSYHQVTCNSVEQFSCFRNEQHRPCTIQLAHWCVQLFEQKKRGKDWHR